MSAKETPAKTPVAPTRAQPHGGAIRTGNPGNKGGRPPSELRALAREMLSSRLPLLGTFARSRKEKTGDRIRAIEALAKIGLEESISITDVRVALDATGELIRDRLPHEQADKLIDDIRAIWMRL